MRKLTTLCCLLAAISLSFFACQKNEGFEPNSLSILSTTTPLSKQVSELTTQSLDYHHLNSIQAVQPSPTHHNSARFVLTYFTFFEEEKERSYTSHTLKSTLIEAGLSEKEACRRTERIFTTMDCSPTYLAETAQLLSATLPSHTEGVFICELFKPYDDTQMETFSERQSKSGEPKVLYKKTNAQQHVKEVNRLLGVCGSIAAYGGNRIELIFNSVENNVPISHLLNYQDVRLVLQETRGYTKGEAFYLKLILGELTEQEVWLLFETDIIPSLLKDKKIAPQSRMTRLFFRYNYVEIIGSAGRLGYTVYDLEGFTE